MRRKLFNFAAAVSLLFCVALFVWRFTAPARLVQYTAVSSMIDETGKTTVIGTSTGTVRVYDDDLRLGRHRLPFMLAVLLTAVAPVLWIALWIARRLAAWATMRAVGCCHHCGYNLTGNTSGVCPECGTPVAGNAGAQA